MSYRVRMFVLIQDPVQQRHISVLPGGDQSAYRYWVTRERGESSDQITLIFLVGEMIEDLCLVAECFQTKNGFTGGSCLVEKVDIDAKGFGKSGHFKRPRDQPFGNKQRLWAAILF